jgi:hypothetical protein
MLLLSFQSCWLNLIGSECWVIDVLAYSMVTILAAHAFFVIWIYLSIGKESFSTSRASSTGDIILDQIDAVFDTWGMN